MEPGEDDLEKPSVSRIPTSRRDEMEDKRDGMERRRRGRRDVGSMLGM